MYYNCLVTNAALNVLCAVLVEYILHLKVMLELLPSHFYKHHSLVASRCST